jgi:exportin-1
MDVTLFDQTVRTMYTTANLDAQKALIAFQSHPQAWCRVGEILEKATEENSKILALAALDNAVKTRWSLIPAEDRENLRRFTIQFLNSLCLDFPSKSRHQLVVRKMNLIIVQVSSFFHSVLSLPRRF